MVWMKLLNPALEQGWIQFRANLSACFYLIVSFRFDEESNFLYEGNSRKVTPAVTQTRYIQQQAQCGLLFSAKNAFERNLIKTHNASFDGISN